MCVVLGPTLSKHGPLGSLVATMARKDKHAAMLALRQAPGFAEPHILLAMPHAMKMPAQPLPPHSSLLSSCRLERSLLTARYEKEDM